MPGAGVGRKAGMDWPSWWHWELDLSPHLLKRMVDRGFTEVDLRAMLAAARAVRKGPVPDRWVVETRHKRRSWEVVVEPDEGVELVVVVTAYPVS